MDKLILKFIFQGQFTNLLSLFFYHPSTTRSYLGVLMEFTSTEKTVAYQKLFLSEYLSLIILIL